MHVRQFALLGLLMSVSFGSPAETFKKEIVVPPKTTETVVVTTDVPVSFNAGLVKADFPEAIRCGNCLHIETITKGSKNAAASSFGVGFMRVPPENGTISVDVYHDYDATKTIQITAEPYKPGS